MSAKIRIGVIGLGIMGEQYVRFYSGHPWTEVTTVSSRRAGHAAEIARKYGVGTVVTDWRDLVESAAVDAVCVATPDDLHFAPAAAAIRAGKHVLIEKPMTTDLGEADALVDLAEQAGLKVQVAFNHRWLSSYHHGHTMVRQGAIGAPLCGYARKNDTIFVPTQYITWAHQTTPAWFLNCHDIDLMRWFFESEPVEARAWGVKKVLAERGIDTWDVIQSQVRFASGAIATFECGWIYPNTFPTMVDSFVEVIGERGHLHFDRKRESIEASTEQAFTYPKPFLASDVFGTLRGAFPACLDDFVRSIREDLPVGAGVRDGRQVTAVLMAIHESLRTGESVAVPAPKWRTEAS